MSFNELFPSWQGWVAELKNVPPGSLVADSVWLYAVFGAAHLLFIALLGGAVILLNMRMLGVGMTSVTAADTERNLRPYFIIGFVGVIFTGIVIGWANADKLYASTSFLVKMISLTGAILFSFGVAATAARSEGELPTASKVMAVLAFGFWVWAMYIFSSVEGTNPGAVHLIFAAFLILLAVARRMTRLIALAIAAVLFLAYVILGYFVFGGPDNNYDAVLGQYGDDGNLSVWGVTQWCVNIAAVAVTGLLAYELLTHKAESAKPTFTKAVALFSILCWVTVTAAGRWIGLAP
jgi:hypothetical protein